MKKILFVIISILILTSLILFLPLLEYIILKQIMVGKWFSYKLEYYNGNLDSNKHSRKYLNQDNMVLKNNKIIESINITKYLLTKDKTLTWNLEYNSFGFYGFRSKHFYWGSVAFIIQENPILKEYLTDAGWTIMNRDVYDIKIINLNKISLKKWIGRKVYSEIYFYKAY